MTQQINKRLAVLLICASASMAFAQSNFGGQHHGPPQMSDEQRAAFEACAAQAGMPQRGSGTRPTQAQHEAFRSCLQSKGISMPEHPHGRGGQAPGSMGQDNGQQPPPPPPDDGE